MKCWICDVSHPIHFDSFFLPLQHEQIHETCDWGHKAYWKHECKSFWWCVETQWLCVACIYNWFCQIVDQIPHKCLQPLQ